MDATDQAAAAVLTQEYNGDENEIKEMPIAYLSAQFSDTQFKWNTVVKEVYAIYYAIKKWREMEALPWRCRNAVKRVM